MAPQRIKALPSRPYPPSASEAPAPVCGIARGSWICNETTSDWILTTHVHLTDSFSRLSGAPKSHSRTVPSAAPLTRQEPQTARVVTACSTRGSRRSCAPATSGILARKWRQRVLRDARGGWLIPPLLAAGYRTSPSLLSARSLYNVFGSRRKWEQSFSAGCEWVCLLPGEPAN